MSSDPVRDMLAGILEPYLPGHADMLVAAIQQGFRDINHAIVPVQPTTGLLVSMAMRYDHTFIIPASDAFKGLGFTPEQRESLLVTMEQLHEEVVGAGFYNPSREDGYAACAKDGGLP